MELEKHLDHLRTRLAQCGATRKGLAAETGGKISASWISKFASGRMKNPRIDTLISIAKALDRLEG
jgi:transcriptional regulator with XRE-family HTH domain